MSTRKKLHDPDLPEEEVDAIISDFIQRHENDQLRKRYNRILKDDYQVLRSTRSNSAMSFTKKRRYSISLLAVAASIALVLLLWRPWQQPAPEVLLATYLDPARQTMPTVRSAIPTEATERTTLKTLFRQKYQAGAYAEAVYAGQNLSKRSATENYFLALAHLGANDRAAALQLFQQLSNDKIYQDEANWYITLLEYSIGDRQKSIRRLKDYQQGSPFYEAAQQLLKSIGQ